jgi:hypothetical protein
MYVIVNTRHKDDHVKIFEVSFMRDTLLIYSYLLDVSLFLLFFKRMLKIYSIEHGLLHLV